MTIAATALQLTATTIEISWSSTDASPAAGWKIDRDTVPASSVKVLTTDLIGDNRVFLDDIAADGIALGTVLEYFVIDNDTAEVGSAVVTVVDLEVGCQCGPVDFLASSIRYTSLDAVKKRLGIESAETAWDVEITQAVIAGEVAIDAWLGRSFPDECIPGIPSQIRQSAENVGVAIFRGTDSPFGVIGSDDYIGELDVTEVVRREMGRSMLLRGLRVSWGVA